MQSIIADNLWVSISLSSKHGVGSIQEKSEEETPVFYKDSSLNSLESNIIEILCMSD